MKNLILILTLIFMFGSCSDQQKLVSLIKNYMNKNVDDIDSYEPVEFFELENDSSKYLDEVEYLDFRSEIDKYEESIKELNFLADLEKIDDNTLGAIVYMETALVYYDSIADCMDREKKFINNYKPRHIGYKMKHSYRMKKDGETKLFKKYFYFNLDKNKITFERDVKY